MSHQLATVYKVEAACLGCPASDLRSPCFWRLEAWAAKQLAVLWLRSYCWCLLLGKHSP